MQVRQQRVQYWDRSFIYWFFNGEWHRDRDLPATYHFINGKLISVNYRQNGKIHRATGPAYIYYVSKNKLYYYQGSKYASLEHMQMVEACR